MDRDEVAADAGTAVTTCPTTMGGILSGGEKAAVVDSVPSSSSDAGSSVEITAANKSPEDPISSTSDVGDKTFTHQKVSEELNLFIDSDKGKSDVDSETDMFANECNLSDVPNERITENVDDLVSDLENLLGESPDDYSLSLGRSSDVGLLSSNKLDEADELEEMFKNKGSEHSMFKSTPIEKAFIESENNSKTIEPDVDDKIKELPSQSKEIEHPVPILEEITIVELKSCIEKDEATSSSSQSMEVDDGLIVQSQDLDLCEPKEVQSDVTSEVMSDETVESAQMDVDKDVSTTAISNEVIVSEPEVAISSESKLEIECNDKTNMECEIDTTPISCVEEDKTENIVVVAPIKDDATSSKEEILTEPEETKEISSTEQIEKENEADSSVKMMDDVSADNKQQDDAGIEDVEENINDEVISENKEDIHSKEDIEMQQNVSEEISQVVDPISSSLEEAIKIEAETNKQEMETKEIEVNSNEDKMDVDLQEETERDELEQKIDAELLAEEVFETELQTETKVLSEESEIEANKGTETKKDLDYLTTEVEDSIELHTVETMEDEEDEILITPQEEKTSAEAAALEKLEEEETVITEPLQTEQEVETKICQDESDPAAETIQDESVVEAKTLQSESDANTKTLQEESDIEAKTLQDETKTLQDELLAESLQDESTTDAKTLLNQSEAEPLQDPSEAKTLQDNLIAEAVQDESILEAETVLDETEITPIVVEKMEEDETLITEVEDVQTKSLSDESAKISLVEKLEVQEDVQNEVIEDEVVAEILPSAIEQIEEEKDGEITNKQDEVNAEVVELQTLSGVNKEEKDADSLMEEAETKELDTIERQADAEEMEEETLLTEPQTEVLQEEPVVIKEQAIVEVEELNEAAAVKLIQEEMDVDSSADVEIEERKEILEEAIPGDACEKEEESLSTFKEDEIKPSIPEEMEAESTPDVEDEQKAIQEQETIPSDDCEKKEEAASTLTEDVNKTSIQEEMIVESEEITEPELGDCFQKTEEAACTQIESEEKEETKEEEKHIETVVPSIPDETDGCVDEEIQTETNKEESNSSLISEDIEVKKIEEATAKPIEDKPLKRELQTSSEEVDSTLVDESKPIEESKDTEESAMDVDANEFEETKLVFTELPEAQKSETEMEHVNEEQINLDLAYVATDETDHAISVQTKSDFMELTEERKSTDETLQINEDQKSGVTDDVVETNEEASIDLEEQTKLVSIELEETSEVTDHATAEAEDELKESKEGEAYCNLEKELETKVEEINEIEEQIEVNQEAKDAMEEETLKEETLKEETIKEEILKEETLTEETFKEETFKEATIKEGTLKEETHKEETLIEETLKEEILKEETLKEETFKEETLKEETLKEETLKEETLKEEIDAQVEESNEVDQTKILDQEAKEDVMEEETCKEEIVAEVQEISEIAEQIKISDREDKEEAMEEETSKEEINAQSVVPDEEIKMLDSNQKVSKDTVVEETPKEEIVAESGDQMNISNDEVIEDQSRSDAMETLENEPQEEINAAAIAEDDKSVPLEMVELISEVKNSGELFEAPAKETIVCNELKKEQNVVEVATNTKSVEEMESKEDSVKIIQEGTQEDLAKICQAETQDLVEIQEDLVKINLEETQEDLVEINQEESQDVLLEINQDETQEDLVKINQEETQEDLITISQEKAQEDLVEINQEETREDFVQINQEETKEDLVQINQEETQDLVRINQEETQEDLVEINQEETQKEVQIEEVKKLDVLGDEVTITKMEDSEEIASQPIQDEMEVDCPSALNEVIEENKTNEVSEDNKVLSKPQVDNEPSDKDKQELEMAESIKEDKEDAQMAEEQKIEPPTRNEDKEALPIPVEIEQEEEATIAGCTIESQNDDADISSTVVGEASSMLEEIETESSSKVVTDEIKIDKTEEESRDQSVSSVEDHKVEIIEKKNEIENVCSKEVSIESPDESSSKEIPIESLEKETPNETLEEADEQIKSCDLHENEKLIESTSVGASMEHETNISKNVCEIEAKISDESSKMEVAAEVVDVVHNENIGVVLDPKQEKTEEEPIQESEQSVESESIQIPTEVLIGNKINASLGSEVKVIDDVVESKDCVGIEEVENIVNEVKTGLDAKSVVLDTLSCEIGSKTSTSGISKAEMKETRKLKLEDKIESIKEIKKNELAEIEIKDSSVESVKVVENNVKIGLDVKKAEEELKTNELESVKESQKATESVEENVSEESQKVANEVGLVKVLTKATPKRKYAMKKKEIVPIKNKIGTRKTMALIQKNNQTNQLVADENKELIEAKPVVPSRGGRGRGLAKRNSTKAKGLAQADLVPFDNEDKIVSTSVEKLQNEVENNDDDSKKLEEVDLKPVAVPVKQIRAARGRAATKRKTTIQEKILAKIQRLSHQSENESPKLEETETESETKIDCSVSTTSESEVVCVEDDYSKSSKAATPTRGFRGRGRGRGAAARSKQLTESTKAKETLKAQSEVEISKLEKNVEIKITRMSSRKRELKNDDELQYLEIAPRTRRKKKSIEPKPIELDAERKENKMETIVIDDDENQKETDTLVKAALEASFEEPQEIPHDVVMESADLQNKNEKEDLDLIQAAQESQNREAIETNKKKTKSTADKKTEYQKPLNILVDNIQNSGSVIKEAESTTGDNEISVEQYSSKMSQSQELKMTIRKNKTDESILKIFDPKNPSPIEISPSESETEVEETPIPKLIIKQSQCSPKGMSPLKITIKPVMKPEEQKSSPKLIIKPIKLDDDVKLDEKHHSPKITIKPIVKPLDESSERCNSPKITIKPIVKPVEASVSPKIKIKPIVKPVEEDEEKERIVLKINIKDEKKIEETEKLAKIKLKFSRGGKHPHIVNEDEEEAGLKRLQEEAPIEVVDAKRVKLDESIVDDTIVIDDDIVLLDSPLVSSGGDALSDASTPQSAPRKRGRPRKIPLEVREDFKEDFKEEQPNEESSPSGRPKRSCRGQSVRTTLGIKPRKPRGTGRGRGGARGGRVEKPPKKEKISESKLKLIKEAAITAEIAESLEELQDVDMREEAELPIIIIEDSSDEKSKDDNRVEAAEVVLTQSADVVMDEEETRMSAETTPTSRAPTPAKQEEMLATGTAAALLLLPDVVVEESQSSVQSTATTESTKIKSRPRSDVHLEPETIITADQLAEYYWGVGGPYMLQEQVAQFLGVKSFKRKYPGIQRRMVDMQERDFIREGSLASESMCDLGLTAVNSADILDIMYSDFQNKYEEYCKYQRDRQTKDIANKQKALSLAASVEKNKQDITQQAVESAAQWNASFNKARKEERRACMDLQTYTINYPRGSCKQIPTPKIGYYPIALVPGQFTDYYKTFTPTELNNLPLNTMLYHPINVHNEDDSHSDDSGSETDSSSSGSDSSDSDSSDEDCNICGVNAANVASAPKKAVV